MTWLDFACCIKNIIVCGKDIISKNKQGALFLENSSIRWSFSNSKDSILYEILDNTVEVPISVACKSSVASKEEILSKQQKIISSLYSRYKLTEKDVLSVKPLGFKVFIKYIDQLGFTRAEELPLSAVSPIEEELMMENNPYPILDLVYTPGDYWDITNKGFKSDKILSKLIFLGFEEKSSVIINDIRLILMFHPVCGVAYVAENLSLGICRGRLFLEIEKGRFHAKQVSSEWDGVSLYTEKIITGNEDIELNRLYNYLHDRMKPGVFSVFSYDNMLSVGYEWLGLSRVEYLYLLYKALFSCIDSSLWNTGYFSKELNKYTSSEIDRAVKSITRKLNG